MAELRRGVFLLTLDFELIWGSRDLVASSDGLEARARVTRERVFGPLLESLQSRGIRATWATVGHLFLGGAEAGSGGLHPELVPPRHGWWRRPWLDGVPAGTEREHPAWYARSLVERLRDAGQEVGSHGFTHAIWGDPGCSRACAESELRHALAAAADLGIRLQSFVFPRNQAGHLDLLATHGFRCWRPQEPTWYRQSGLPGSAQRLLHLADVARAAAPALARPRRGDHGLWELPASATFLPVDGVRRLIPVLQRVERGRKGLDDAVRERSLFHLYFHPINFASAPDPMLRGLAGVLDHAVRLRDAGRLEIHTMGELAERLEAGG